MDYIHEEKTLGIPFRMAFRKRLRGWVKRCVPYGWQRAYAFRAYGVYFPDCITWQGVAGRMQGLFWAILPFGLVCTVKSMDPDRGCGTRADSEVSFLARVLEPRYRLSGARRKAFIRDRTRGAVEFSSLIRRHAGVRILVVLHLYYENSWEVVRQYLENLSPYGFDLVLTYVQGRCSRKTLDAVAAFSPSVRFVACENRGFDVWPFVVALKDVCLSNYDMVFKVHSKGIGRPFLFIYGQVFKGADWFFNLFDGMLGGRTVHQAVDALSSGRAKLVAAENLIVEDPRHKRNLTRAFCEAHGLNFLERYRFVAGTCFAVRADVLEPLQRLGLTSDDFAPVARGTFSTAHAIERWLCFPAQDALLGLPVERHEYRDEVRKLSSSTALALLDDPRFDLDDEFAYRVLETRSVFLSGYEVLKVRVGDICRMRNDGTVCPLSDCEPLAYLRGDVNGYEAYCRANEALSGFAMSRKRYDRLRESMARGYNPRRMPVVRGRRNILLDGQHRCCLLLDQFGPDHEIEVVRIW